mmetsp:Transcript_8196/g.30242  ORF Transcript_8196/g.30242 Transcript_8196/m.30242 type:complete len:497 (+) Transcript_8196:168-1658(+)
MAAKAAAPPQPLVLRGHGSEVQALAFVPSEPSLLLAGDSSGCLRLWDVTTRRTLLHRRGGHSPRCGGVLGVAVLVSGTVISQSRDGVLCVWRLHVTPEGADHRGPQKHGDSDGASFTPSDSSFERRLVHLSSQPERRIASSSYNFCVLSALFVGQIDNSCRGLELVSVAGGEQGVAEIYNVQNGKQLSKVELKSGVSAVPLAKTVSSCSAGQSDPPESSESLACPKVGLVTALHLYEETRYGQVLLVVGYESGAIALWRLVRLWELSKAAVERIACDAGGSGNDTKHIRPELMQLVTQPDIKHAETVLAVKAQPMATSSKRLSHQFVSGGADACAKCFTIEFGECTSFTGQRPNPAELSSFGMQSAARGSLSASFASLDKDSDSTSCQEMEMNPTAVGATLSMRQEVRAPGASPISPGGFASLVNWRGDGKVFAIGSWSGILRLFDRKHLSLLAVLKYHTQSVTALEFQPGSSLLASASRDGTIALWPLYPSHRHK